MKVIGKITLEQLAQMKARGFGPEAAVDALKSEAKARYPGAAVIIQRSNLHSGFDIVAI